MSALLVMSVFAGFTGGALAQESGNAPDDGSTDTMYYLQQGNTCTPLETFGDGSTTVEEFYDYRIPELNDDGEVNYDTYPEHDYSSYGTQAFQESQHSRLMVYEGAEGVSLVVVNDELDDGNPASANMTFEMSENSLDWAVMDDDYPSGSDSPYGTPDDQFEQNRVYWQWNGERTDGGALRGFESEDSLTITPELSESIEGIEFLSGSSADDYDVISLEESEFTIVRSAENPCGSDSEEPATEEPTTEEPTTEEPTTEEPTGEEPTTEEPSDGDSDGDAGSGNDGGAAPSAEAKAVSASTVSATAASAQIVPPPNGGTVTVPLPSGTSNGVKFQDAKVGVTSKSLSFQMTSSASDNVSASGMQTWAGLELSPQGSEADVTTANVSFTVTKDALNASGVAAEDVTVMYENNGSWEEADTTVSGEGESQYTFAATVPADATLAVGVPGDDGASGEDGGNETTTEGNESTGNETTTTTDETTTSDEGAAQGETETETESGGESGTTASEGAAQGETETDAASGGESGTTSGSVPGFGFTVAVLAIAGSALALLRRR